jgi:L-arabinonolactonase
MNPPPIQPRIERLGPVTTQLGECPLWDAQRQALWCVDSRAGQVLKLDPDTGEAIHHSVPAPIGSIALNEDGRLVLALKETLALYDPATGALQEMAQLGESLPHLRFNDGTAMPDGSFLVGTMHVLRGPNEPPKGGIFRLSPQGQLNRLAPGLGVANGPVLSPLTGRLHIADSTARRLYSYAMLPDGSLQDRKEFAHTEDLGSAPDGCCFDRDGGLWTALVHAGALVRFDAQGQVSHRIELPMKHPTALCFGGPDLDRLFVTSIRDSGRLSSDGPLDGAVLALSGTGFRGWLRPLCRIHRSD